MVSIWFSFWLLVHNLVFQCITVPPLICYEFLDIFFQIPIFSKLSDFLYEANYFWCTLMFQWIVWNQRIFCVMSDITWFSMYHMILVNFDQGVLFSCSISSCSQSDHWNRFSGNFISGPLKKTTYFLQDVKK